MKSIQETQTDINHLWTQNTLTIKSMLKENTGRDLLDSGDIYGRSYETRRGIKSFKEMPAAWAEQDDDGDITLHKSMYHYLTGYLWHERDMTRKFQRFTRRYEARHGNSRCATEAFIEKINDPEADWKPGFTNTSDAYPYFLDGIMAFEVVWREEFAYIILQIHGGCDVRDGYTAPKIFSCERLSDFDNKYSEMLMTCKCMSISIGDGRQEPIDGFELLTVKDDLPEFWKYHDKQLHCTKCNETVKLS